MERKIGEIFEFGGEWYQCLKSASCDECAFLNSNCIDNPSLKCSVDDRTDNCSVIFKKLEKWREPYPNADKLYQLYKLPMNIEKLPPHTEGINLVRFDIVEIEIKQNKEDMEEEREYTEDEFKNSPRFQHHKNIEQVINMKKMKEFDINLAKQGKPVCTRDGRKARIICFDRNDLYPIVALIECKDGKEIVGAYSNEGKTEIYEIKGTDLMMLPEKKEGWINIYKKSNGECYFAHIYDTKALAEIGKDAGCIATVRIEWEE